MGERAFELRLLDWALLWSPLQPYEARAAAWCRLELAGEFDALASASFITIFEMDLPQPQVPLLFSAALQREAAACREDWMRIAHHFGMQRVGASLPPDHLALACELLAHAFLRQDIVLMTGMWARYLKPWLEHAKRCESPLCKHLAQAFNDELQWLYSSLANSGETVGVTF